MTLMLLVGAFKSIYEMKCALLDKIVNFGTQIVEIILYRNFDGGKLVRPVFGRHLGTYIQQYYEKEDTKESSYQANFFMKEP